MSRSSGSGQEALSEAERNLGYFTLNNTDLIATLPSQIVQTFVEVWQLHASPLPFEMPGFSVDLLWHTKSDRDPGHRWLRNLIAQICPEEKQLLLLLRNPEIE
jgi:DNA-binding transcriptional LysR family regulator